jgi:uncharacterized repeat protein (TIGR03803 family)
MRGSDGNFYGTTGSIFAPSFSGGGAYKRGTLFKVTPAGVETVLYSFGASGAADGTNPISTLIQDADGNFYGTTDSGGAYNQGTVFKISPAGVETWVYSFSGNGPAVGAPGQDGSTPYAGLIQGSDGNFYGTTNVGGAYGYGTVFKITPAGVETVLYSFTAGNLCVNYVCRRDGGQPWAPLVKGNDGNFYGTTFSPSTVFKITPAGDETVLYSFTGSLLGGAASADGAGPAAGLTLGTDGNFYGTTFAGGAYASGTVFKISPAGAESILHAFSGGYVTYGIGVHGTSGGVQGSWDAATPSYGALVQGSDGIFYGTTRSGGAYNSGAIFKITASGLETVLYSFTGNGGIAGSADGAYPEGGLIQVSDGTFYGTTVNGGATNEGTVFSFSTFNSSP